jgi:iron complex outermembrane receptor protein
MLRRTRTSARCEAKARGFGLIAPIVGISPLALAISAAIAQEAPAQGPGDASDTLDEVVVTGRREFFRPIEASSATRFNLPVFETPQSISVITDDLIGVFLPRDRNEFSKYVAGTYSLTDAAGSYDLFGSGLAVRGFPISGDNGYKVNGFSALGTFRPDMAMVERVEFVKGPTAITHGVNNYGGLVNTVTKRPKFEQETWLGVELGDFDYKRVEVDTTGPIPGTERFRYRMIAAYQEREFAQDGSESDHYTFMPAISWDLTDETELNLTAFFQKESLVPCNSYDLTLDENGRTVLPFAISRDVCTSAVEVTHQESEHRQVIADFKHRFAGDAYLKGQVGWSKSEADWRGVYTYNFFGPSAPTSYVYGSRERNELETYDVELDFGSDFEAFGRQHTFLISADYRTLSRDIPTYQYVYYGYVDAFAPDFSFIDFDDPASIPIQDGFRLRDDTRLGLGAQIFFRATDRLSILAGLRWSQIDFTNEATDTLGGQVDPDLAPFVIESEDKFDEITTRLGVVYSLTPNLNLFASYSEGFLPQTGVKRDLTTVGPETGIQLEGGLKAEFFAGKLGGSLTYYHIDRENVQTEDPDNGIGEDYVVEGREQRHKGVELEVVGRLVDGLNLVLTYAHQDAEVTKNLPDPLIVGNEISRVADHLANASFDYKFQNGALKDFSFGASASYMSEYFTREDEFRFEMPETWSADVHLAFDGFKNTSLRLVVNNVTNEDDFLGPRGCRYSCFPRVEPRSFKVKASYKF